MNGVMASTANKTSKQDMNPTYWKTYVAIDVPHYGNAFRTKREKKEVKAAFLRHLKSKLLHCIKVCPE